MANNKCFFEKGQYYFGFNMYHEIEVQENHLISFENYIYAPLCDASDPGMVYVCHDGKWGVFTRHHVDMGMMSYGIFKSNIFPFVYDEIWHNGDFCGDGVGYAAVRINHCWGILRIEDILATQDSPAYRPCMMIIPCIHPTREKAINLIKSKDYHPTYGWVNLSDIFDKHSL